MGAVEADGGGGVGGGGVNTGSGGRRGGSSRRRSRGRGRGGRASTDGARQGDGAQADPFQAADPFVQDKRPSNALASAPGLSGGGGGGEGGAKFGGKGKPKFGGGKGSFGGGSDGAAFGSGAPGFGGGSQGFGVGAPTAFGGGSGPAFGSGGVSAFGNGSGSGAPAFGSKSGPAFGSGKTQAFGSVSGNKAPAFGGGSGPPAFGSGSGNGAAVFGGGAKVGKTPVFRGKSGGFGSGFGINSNTKGQKGAAFASFGGDGALKSGPAVAEDPFADSGSLTQAPRRSRARSKRDLDDHSGPLVGDPFVSSGADAARSDPFAPSKDVERPKTPSRFPKPAPIFTKRFVNSRQAPGPSATNIFQGGGVTTPTVPVGGAGTEVSIGDPFGGSHQSRKKSRPIPIPFGGSPSGLSAAGAASRGAFGAVAKTNIAGSSGSGSGAPSFAGFGNTSQTRESAFGSGFAGSSLGFGNGDAKPLKPGFKSFGRPISTMTPAVTHGDPFAGAKADASGNIGSTIVGFGGHQAKHGSRGRSQLSPDEGRAVFMSRLPEGLQTEDAIVHHFRTALSGGHVEVSFFRNSRSTAKVTFSSKVDAQKAFTDAASFNGKELHMAPFKPLAERNAEQGAAGNVQQVPASSRDVGFGPGAQNPSGFAQAGSLPPWGARSEQTGPPAGQTPSAGERRKLEWRNPSLSKTQTAEYDYGDGDGDEQGFGDDDGEERIYANAHSEDAGARAKAEEVEKLKAQIRAKERSLEQQKAQRNATESCRRPSRVGDGPISSHGAASNERGVRDSRAFPPVAWNASRATSVKLPLGGTKRTTPHVASEVSFASVPRTGHGAVSLRQRAGVVSSTPSRNLSLFSIAEGRKNRKFALLFEQSVPDPGTIVSVRQPKKSEAKPSARGTKAGKIHFEDAVAFVGECSAMCSNDEVVKRTGREISLFEKMDEDGNIGTENSFPVPELMVKKYQRAAADKGVPGVDQVRPPHVLDATMDHLFLKILDLEHALFVDIYTFIYDRDRGVRKDLGYQPSLIEDDSYLAILEKSIRFLIFSEHKLAAESIDAFSSSLNMGALDNALTSISICYEARRLSGIPSPNESEFQAYSLLRFCSPLTVAVTCMALPHEILFSDAVRFALLALELNNDSCLMYVEFMELVKEAPIILSCFLYRMVSDVQFRALNIMSAAGPSQKKRGENYRLEYLTDVLGFDDLDHTAEFCKAHGLAPDLMAGNVRLDRKALRRPDGKKRRRWQDRPSPRLVLNKIGSSSLSDIMLGLNSPTAFKQVSLDRIRFGRIARDALQVETMFLPKKIPAERAASSSPVTEQNGGDGISSPALEKLPTIAPPPATSPAGISKPPPFVPSVDPFAPGKKQSQPPQPRTRREVVLPTLNPYKKDSFGSVPTKSLSLPVPKSVSSPRAANGELAPETVVSPLFRSDRKSNAGKTVAPEAQPVVAPVAVPPPVVVKEDPILEQRRALDQYLVRAVALSKGSYGRNAVEDILLNLEDSPPFETRKVCKKALEDICGPVHDEMADVWGKVHAFECAGRKELLDLVARVESTVEEHAASLGRAVSALRESGREAALRLLHEDSAGALRAFSDRSTGRRLKRKRGVMLDLNPLRAIQPHARPQVTASNEVTMSSVLPRMQDCMREEGVFRCQTILLALQDEGANSLRWTKGMVSGPEDSLLSDAKLLALEMESSHGSVSSWLSVAQATSIGFSFDTTSIVIVPIDVPKPSKLPPVASRSMLHGTLARSKRASSTAARPPVLVVVIDSIAEPGENYEMQLREALDVDSMYQNCLISAFRSVHVGLTRDRWDPTQPQVNFEEAMVWALATVGRSAHRRTGLSGVTDVAVKRANDAWLLSVSKNADSINPFRDTLEDINAAWTELASELKIESRRWAPEFGEENLRLEEIGLTIEDTLIFREADVVTAGNARNYIIALASLVFGGIRDLIDPRTTVMTHKMFCNALGRIIPGFVSRTLRGVGGHLIDLPLSSSDEDVVHNPRRLKRVYSLCMEVPKSTIATVSAPCLSRSSLSAGIVRARSEDVNASKRISVREAESELRASSLTRLAETAPAMEKKRRRVNNARTAPQPVKRARTTDLGSGGVSRALSFSLDASTPAAGQSSVAEKENMRAEIEKMDWALFAADEYRKRSNTQLEKLLLSG